MLRPSVHLLMLDLESSGKDSYVFGDVNVSRPLLEVHTCKSLDKLMHFVKLSGASVG